MKIFSIIGNYKNHADLSAALTADWWVIPDSAMLRSGKPVFLPGEEGRYSILPSLCMRINRLGKCVAPKFASRYFTEVAPALQFVDKNVLSDLAEGRQPRQSDVIFDNAIIVGDFIPATDIGDGSVEVSLNLTDGSNFTWLSSNALLSNEEIIALVSARNTLKMGDLILTALPSSGLTALRDVGATASINGNELLHFRLK